MITHKKHPYNKIARIQTAGEVLWLVKSTPTYFRTAQANLAEMVTNKSTSSDDLVQKLLVSILLDYLLLVNT